MENKVLTDIIKTQQQILEELENLRESKDDKPKSVGEVLADKVVSFLGSWNFIIIQSSLLVVWVILNIMAWVYHWDPYPFILLNLVLSFQAAYATPLILMANNRAEIKDRRRALEAYKSIENIEDKFERLWELIRLHKTVSLENGGVNEGK